ncbi:MAG: small basic family protein [Patescibacteria group bacterium]|nr:small basic family protein [Patescibacteria group bacterium]
MLYAILGIFLGTILGAFLPFNIAPEYSRYTAVAILAILDSLIGAIGAQTKKEFNVANFITGLLFYVFIAAFFVYLGDKLNLDLYLGVTVVFMFRIIQKVAVLRDFYFKRFFDKEVKIKE